MREKYISLKDITLTYPDHKHPILDKFSLDIFKGDFIILVGANGSGKSTLFRLLTSRVSSQSGKIEKPHDLKIAYICQNIEDNLFLDLTIAENLSLLRVYYKDKKEISSYLKEFNSKLPAYLDQPVKYLSGGEKQALILAIKLYSKPDLLLLDEHTSALDPEAENTLMKITSEKITKNNITTIMSTHNLSHIREYGKRIIGINKGKVLYDELNSKSIKKKYLDIIYN